MSLITRMRRQKATWFRRIGFNALGEPSFASGVEIACRWSDRQQQVIRADRSVQMSKSKVYVDRDMDVGDRLQKALPADSDVSRADEIIAVGDIPNLRATESLKIAYL